MIGPKLLCLLLLLCLILSGCGFKDIDKRFFVVAMGIDKSEDPTNPYRITLKLAVPSPQIAPGTSKSQNESINAGSIAEGVRMLKSHVDKELDFGHCKIFLIGEQIARDDYNNFIQWMQRRRDIQSVADMGVGKPDAESLLRINPVSERYPGNTLFLSFGADGTDNPYTYMEPASDFFRRVSERGMDPLLPVIQQDHVNKEGYIINRNALMDKTHIKLILNPNESQLFNQLAKKLSKSSVTAKYNGEEFIGVITQIHRKYTITNKDGKPLLKMTVRIKALLEQAPPNLFNQEWSKIEKKLSEDYAQEAKALLVKIQKAGVDPMGFGLRYRATHPGDQAWKDWQSIYPELEFAVDASITIEGTGLIK